MKRTFLVVAVLVLAGCSSTSFVGKRLDNFTAYYNTFYNAKRAYADALKAMDQPDRAIDRTTYLYVFDPGNRGTGTKDFENAIKKSADVLRGHPDSKWVDDALLLIGKSYYYMGNTVGAQQKFREVIDRESGLENEARFWLGLALMASGSLDEAAAHLQASLERERVSRKWTSRMRLALGELYVRQERWEEAAEQLEAGADRVGDDELGSRSQFLLGQVLETIGDYDRAAKAYRDVSRFKPTYELSYAAQFSAVRVEGEHGDPEVALQALRKMERDDKNFAYRSELSYLRGRVVKAASRSEDALYTFYDVLYGSDANISSIRGPTHYHLGLLFRDQFVDFDRAAAHFDTAATALGRNTRQTTPGRTETLAPAPYAITDAGDLAEVFGKFADFNADVHHYDSLLTLGLLDEDAFRERIEEIRVQRAEEIVEERRSQERLAAEASFRRTGAIEPGRPGAAAAGGSADYSAAGFLYHRDRSRVQEGLLSFFDRWGERPHVPNWRRSAAIAGARAASAEGDAEEADVQDQVAQPVSDMTTEALLSSVDIDISDVPRTAERQAEMRRMRAEARYELGNVLFLSIGMPDSAAAWYRSVLEEAEDPEITARALYALAEVQHSLGDDESASAIYQRVLDEYPDSEVASRAAQRLGLEEAAVDVAASEMLTTMYQSAFDRWVDGSFPGAMRDMLDLAAGYPDSLVSGRALLAAGAIYVDWAETEGRDILDPIAVGVPDSLWTRLGLVEASSAPAVDTTSAAVRPGGEVRRDSVRTDSVAVDVSTGEVEAAISPDSTRGARVDSLVVDTPAVVDSTGVPADSAVVRTEDAALAPAETDSLVAGGAGRSGDVTADTTGAGPRVYLLDLYRLVTTRYSGSPYAVRAAELAAAIEERQAPPADTTAVEDVAALAPAEKSVEEAPVIDQPAATRDSTLAQERTELRAVLEDDVVPTRRRAELRDDAAGLEAARTDTTVYDEADSAPVLVGGEGALERMFRYPDSANEAGVSGRVGVTFIVDQRGRVVQPRVESSVGAGCDDEALRVIRLARFRPAIRDGLPVRLRMSREIQCGPGVEP